MDPLLFGIGGGLLSLGGSLLSGLGSRSRARRARREFKKAWRYAEQERARFEEQIAPVRRFYEEYFQEQPRWMTETLRTQIRAAQEARGLAYGGQPAAWEAQALTSQLAAARAGAGSALVSLAQLPLQQMQTAFAMRSQQAQQLAETQGPSPLELAGIGLANALQGVFGGAQIGLALQRVQQPSVGALPTTADVARLLVSTLTRAPVTSLFAAPLVQLFGR